MFLERLNVSGIKGSKYWYDPAFNKGANTETGMPNCVCYCTGRVQEEQFAEEPVKLFKDRAPGGFPNAKDWYNLWAYEKGEEPMAGGVLVWDGYKSSQAITSYGHVASVERVIERTGAKSWRVLVSQSAYGGYFWKKAEYIVSPGIKTPGVGYVYLGCCYNPNIKNRIVPRNTNKDQVEVLAEMLNVREKPNGDNYKGRYCPKGLYNVFAFRDSGAYTWAKLDSGCWIALNDADGWTITHRAVTEESTIAKLESRIVKLEAEIQTMTEANAKVNRLYNALLEEKDKLTYELTKKTAVIDAVRKAVE